MSCPDLDTLLDLGFDASPEQRHHLESCPACEAELAAAAALAAGFAEMRAESIPADLLAESLASARPARIVAARAPDRPAWSRSSRRRAGLASAIAVCTVLLALWAWPRADEPAPAPLVAEQPVPTPVEPLPVPPPAPLPPVPTPIPPTAVADTAPERLVPAPDDVTPEPAHVEQRPSPGAVAEPTFEPSEPASLPAPQDPVDDLVAQSQPALPDSVAAARDGALLALGFVADAQRSAQRSVAGELRRLGSTLSTASEAPFALTP